MKKLPIGISTLQNIRSDSYIYIDKTHHITKFNEAGGRYYFLSRPRRFGKSLFLDTLKQAFRGNKTLFKGLYLEKNWNWATAYPVLHFGFAGGSAYKREGSLLQSIDLQLSYYAKQYGVELDDLSPDNKFEQLLIGINQKTNQQIVVLIDEYDKPILDVIADYNQAATNREILKSFYSVMKNHDAILRFVFLTGVSKFSKISVFSGLNNLNDISLDADFADICGYTQQELEQAFGEYLKDGNVDKAKLKQWYNGYNFAGSDKQKVYNPFDILLFCSKKYQYDNYWFETATPKFLIELLKQKQTFIPKLESYKVTSESLKSFELDELPFQTLLFQTGYLTIKQIITIGMQRGYVLSFPNLEVKASMNAHIMRLGTTQSRQSETFSEIAEVIEGDDYQRLKVILNSHFASIPHDWYRNNPIGQYEGFYASIVYSCFAALGYDVRAEDATNIGKIDLSINAPDKVLIIEFKLAKYGNAQQALKQIKDKAYAAKFKASSKPIYLIGISFDDQKKQVQEILVEQMNE